MVDLLAPVLNQIHKLWARVDRMPVVRWATVVQVSPLRVMLDGDLDVLPFTPATTVHGLPVGARVVCVEQHRRVIVVSAATRPLPAPVRIRVASPMQITAPAATWQTIPAYASEPSVVNFGALPRPLEVDLVYNAIAETSDPLVYGMLGVACAGGLALAPDFDQRTGLQQFEYTPYSTAAASNAIFGTKSVVLPAGAATDIFLQGRRNMATGTQTMSYPQLKATPVRWAD